MYSCSANVLLMWRKEDVVNKLKDEQGDQSLRSFARIIGCSAAYLCDVYKDRREPGPKILRHLKLQRKSVTTVTYVERKWK